MSRKNNVRLPNGSERYTEYINYLKQEEKSVRNPIEAGSAER